MSSLLQFAGEIGKKGVGLLFYLVVKGKDWEKYNGPEAYKPNPEGTTFCDDLEPVKLVNDKDGSIHTVPQLYRCWRKPCGMCGCWVGFRYNGKIHYPDLSIPIRIHKLPRDAEKLSEEEMKEYWFN